MIGPMAFSLRIRLLPVDRLIVMNVVVLRNGCLLQPDRQALRQGIGCGQRKKQNRKLQDRQQRQTHNP